MQFAVVDIETTGLDVDTVDIHCIVVTTDDGSRSFDPDEIQEGIEHLNGLLSLGVVLVAHNGIDYDIPILERYGMNTPGVNQIYDTRIASRAAYPGATLQKYDSKFLLKYPHLREDWGFALHSLKNWGMRLGCPKDDYDGGWETFNQEMLDYCVQDTVTNLKVLDFLRTKIPDEAALLDCEVARHCRQMRLTGVGFDVPRAHTFAAELMTKRQELGNKLIEAFGWWWAPNGKLSVPKKSMTSKKYSPGEPGYKNTGKGCSYQNIKQVQFNPASTSHIGQCLIKKYGWKPELYTDGGQPKVTAEILRDLDYPEAPLLAEYQEVKKILGYISEGTGAWTKLEKNGRLHGTVHATGTVSGRASHNSPNTGNVPSRSELGHGCRSLFCARQGRTIVGADASGLQLRGFAHYLAKWDGRTFATQCETGDVHEYMRAATGLYTRDFQKTWTYAKLFGAGKGKLGATVILDHHKALALGLTEEPAPPQSKAVSLGRQSLDNLGNAIPAVNELNEMLAAAAKRGHLRTLDGRKLPISSDHIAIAMLLQGFEAVVMKRAMVIAEARVPKDCDLVLWVHDEFQYEVPVDMADEVGKILVESLNEAGEYYNLRVKIDGEYKVGNTWAETH